MMLVGGVPQVPPGGLDVALADADADVLDTELDAPREVVELPENDVPVGEDDWVPDAVLLPTRDVLLGEVVLTVLVDERP